MMNHEVQMNLKEKCRDLRADLLKMLCKAGSGHAGGSLSSTEILAVLYYQVMKHDPQNPLDPQRDRFVLSKGHVCPIHYVLLADCGYFDSKHLDTLREYGSLLQGHPHRLKTPGVDCSSGSLGQGLSVATGMAMGLKKDGGGQRVYCLLGDGELQEGQVWEAAMSAAHFHLDNLCAVVDQNGLQIDGAVKDVMNIEPLAEKWRSFGWHVVVCDGHQLDALRSAFLEAMNHGGKPTVILAQTQKGKGVSFMEGVAAWHGKAPNATELELALKELNAQDSEGV